MAKHAFPPGGEVSQSLRGITRQEAKLLTLLAEGMSNRQISACLGISVQTVKNHTSRIYKKLGVANRVQAVIMAQQMTMVLF